MTTYSAQAVYYTVDFDNLAVDPNARVARTIDVSISFDGGSIMNYTAFTGQPQAQVLTFGNSEGITLTTSHNGLGDMGDVSVGLAYTLTWSGGVTTFVDLYFDDPEEANVSRTLSFAVGGDPFPFVSNVSQFENLRGLNPDQTSVLAHDLGPGDTWNIGNILSAQAATNVILDNLNNWYTVNANDGTIDALGGTDTISFVSMTGSMTVKLPDGTATMLGDAFQFSNFENVTGSIYGDYIEGDSGANTIRGLGGYDWLVASDGADTYDGGSGLDMVSYVNATSGVHINLGGGFGIGGIAGGDSFTSIERVTGSIYNDLMYGSNGEDQFRGLGGYDWFVGSGGGRDKYDGGSGQDTVSYIDSDSRVFASLTLGRGSLGDADRDLYTSIENLGGTNFNDVLTGDGGRNVLRGFYGEDVLFGGGGSDRLIGGGSDDVLNGGDGWDYAIFEGNRDEYVIRTRGIVTEVDRIASGGEGTDDLLNIEVIRFADGDVLI